ncbi:hypothetical protein CKO51_06195 [Rhodopirellula sp. SM50]|nr:hypothetical protein CKO51_06195 [Rhodopirellula sp. SM50]
MQTTQIASFAQAFKTEPWMPKHATGASRSDRDRLPYPAEAKNPGIPRNKFNFFSSGATASDDNDPDFFAVSN